MSENHSNRSSRDMPDDLITSTIALPGQERAPAIDLSRLVQLAGTPERFKEIAANFSQGLSERLGRIGEAHSRNDCHQCAQVAHAAAGACGAVGATELAKLLKQVEEDAFAEQSTKIPPLLARVEAEFTRVRTALARPPEPVSAATASAPVGSGRVLIIEDDVFVAGLYRKQLDNAGYEVAYAQDGQAGFYSIHEWKPDLVLLDLMLPNIGGLDILKKIRAERAYRELPVLVFTNALIPSLLNDAIDAGANHVFNKTQTGPEEMLDVIRETLAPAVPKSPGRGSEGAPKKSAAAATARSTHTPVLEEPESTEDVTEAPASPDSEPLSAPADAPARRQPRRFDATSMRMRRPPAGTPPAATPPTPVAESEATPTDTILEIAAAVRSDFKGFAHATRIAEKTEILGRMYQRMHALTGTAGMGGMKALAELTGALELFIHELKESPADIGKTTIRTVAQAIDFLARLAGCQKKIPPIRGSDPMVLVVDDDRMCREVVGHALKRAGIASLQTDAAETALKAAEGRAFDLIVLDVNMPGMDGFELCRRIRKMREHAATPLVFVTGLDDLASRGQSRLSGGDDHITKPFRMIELTVKAIIHILTARMSKPIK